MRRDALLKLVHQSRADNSTERVLRSLLLCAASDPDTSTVGSRTVQARTAQPIKPVVPATKSFTSGYFRPRARIYSAISRLTFSRAYF